MNNNDYELIARVLRYSMNHLTGNSAEDVMNMTIENMSEDIMNNNPNFDKTKFEEAAGYCAKVPSPDISYDDALGQTRN